MTTFPVRSAQSAATWQAPSVIQMLRTDGVVKIGRLPNVAEFVRYLQGQKVYPGHVKAKGNGHPTTVRENRHTSYDMQSLLTAPHFFKFALSLTDLIGEYLGVETPKMYSLNAFWTTRRDGIHFGTQAWHRDPDDSKFVALFMYGTDVLNHEDGPHQFQLGTHDGREDGVIETIFGEAGTLFLADTRGIHRGISPQRDPRLLAWCRWGVSDLPRSYIVDKLRPVDKSIIPDYPKNERLRRSIRLVAA